MCEAALARDPARPAIEFQGQWVSWGQLRRLASQLDALVAQSGLDPRSPIVFVPHNRPSAAAALVAMSRRARSVSMVYAFQSPEAIARDLERLAPALVVASAEVFTPAVRAPLAARGAAAIALHELDASLLAGLEHCGEATSVNGPGQPELQILTSGTTGAPKRFGMTHEMIARHVVGANKNYQSTGDAFALPPMFSYYPLGNISGIYGVLPPLLRGQRVVLVDRFTVALWREYLRRHRPERASLPPAGFQMVLDADVPRAELACVRCIHTGAAPLDPDVQRQFEARYGVPVLSSYGATEFGGPVASMSLELHAQWGARKFGSVGRPLAGAQLRVVDPATGAVLEPGCEGLLEVMTPRIGSSWIRTSDLAMIDADGFMFHRGRADGAIVRGGFKLLPEVIERALTLHPSVSAAAVVGVPDARLGHVPAAVVELRASARRPTPSELEQHLREHVYATHIPAAWRLVDALPRTGSLKVDYAAVRGLFAPA
jgi:acyl-coenzyme A synthetase/AMP-(fatty) acid ligase